MQWNLSPEQDAYQEAFRDWLSDVAAPDTVRRWLDAGDAAAFEQLFTGGGWSGGWRLGTKKRFSPYIIVKNATARTVVEMRQLAPW